MSVNHHHNNYNNTDDHHHNNYNSGTHYHHHNYYNAVYLFGDVQRWHRLVGWFGRWVPKIFERPHLRQSIFSWNV